MNYIGHDYAARARPYTPLLADHLHRKGERVEPQPAKPVSDAQRRAEIALRNHDGLERWKRRNYWRHVRAVRADGPSEETMRRVVENMSAFARGLA